VEIGSPSHELQGFLDRQKDNPMDHNKTTPHLFGWVGSAVRPQSTFVCLESPNRGGIRPSRPSREVGVRQRQPLRPEAGPVHCCQPKKDMLPDGLAEAGNHRPHRISSNSRFGRHETGSAIQRLMSDSCQPAPLVLILS
jgi:hypothetical protein